MPIQVACAHCGKTYNLSEDKAGKRYRCTDCQEPIVVPAVLPVDGTQMKKSAPESLARVDHEIRKVKSTQEAADRSESNWIRSKSVWIASTLVLATLTVTSVIMLRGDAETQPESQPVAQSNAPSSVQPVVPSATRSASQPIPIPRPELVTQLSPTLAAHFNARPVDELSFLPAEATTFLLVRSARFVSSPLVRSLPGDFFGEVTKSVPNPLKLDLSKIEFCSSFQVIVEADENAINHPKIPEPPPYVALIRYTTPFNLVEQLWASKKGMAEISQQSYKDTLYLRLTMLHTYRSFEMVALNEYQWSEPTTKELFRTAYVSVDDRTFLVGDEPAIRNLLEKEETRKDGPLNDHIRQHLSDQDMLVVLMPSQDKVLRTPSQTTLGGLIPEEESEEIDELAKNVKFATLSLDLTGEKLLTVDFVGSDEESTHKLQEKAESYRGKIEAQLRAMSELGSMEFATVMQRAAGKLGSTLLGGVSLSRMEQEVKVEIKNPGGWQEFMAEIEPSFRASRQAALLVKKRLNLKRIGVALHNFHGNNNALPPFANLDESINVNNLSWRVWLLPYIGLDDLYGQIHKGEPWDSPHNLKLIDQMPEIYASPGVTETGKTRLLSFSAPDSALGTTRVAFKQIKDGLKNTIAVVEAAPEKAVIWTKPEDLPFDRNNPISALGTIPDEGFLALFVDGSARMIPKSIDAAILKALITIAGGEDVDF